MVANGFYKIEVEDTGIGISDEGQKKLFKTFGKLKDTQNLNENGSGLGLTICKKISVSMKGCIQLVSAPGQGATFTVYIQAYKRDEIEDEFEEEKALDDT